MALNNQHWLICHKAKPNQTKAIENSYNCEGMVIHKEFYKRLNCDLTDKCYMHKLNSVRENERIEILRDV